MKKEVIVVGAGLAGSEAAYQLAKRGIKVKLYEMKAKKKTPAHSKDYFSELVCSNSLGSDSLENASGLMKEELRILGSLLINIADKNLKIYLRIILTLSPLLASSWIKFERFLVKSNISIINTTIERIGFPPLLIYIFIIYPITIMNNSDISKSPFIRPI